MLTLITLGLMGLSVFRFRGWLAPGGDDPLARDKRNAGWVYLAGVVSFSAGIVLVDILGMPFKPEFFIIVLGVLLAGLVMVIRVLLREGGAQGR